MKRPAVKRPPFWPIGERLARTPPPEAGEGLHVFRMPTVEGWQPASVADAIALGVDMALYGTSFATEDGRRVNPHTVEIRDGVAYGGTVELSVTREGAPDIPLTSFTLGEVAECGSPPLTDEELALLRKDEYARSKLRDRFLDACGWTDAAEVAVDAWRAEQER